MRKAESLTVAVERVLDACLAASDAGSTRLNEAMRYSVFAGGKRIRPALVMAACQALGGDARAASYAAAAVELVHTYSLIHDDLPCMDDDDFRRGKPSNHRVYGEALAVLAGDGLLTRAFEVLSCEDLISLIGPATCLRLVRELAAAAGPDGMVLGQAMDMNPPGNPSLQDIRDIEVLKTGRMFKACVRMGALVAGASPHDMDALEGYAQALGLAFQVRDDILDATGDLASLGKTAGKDARQGKATHVALLGLEESLEVLADLVANALDSLSSFTGERTVLSEIAQALLDVRR